MVVVPKKRTLKLGRALKTAARLPARVSGGRGSGRNTFSPAAGELPVVLLRVQVRGCRDLVAKDKSGLSDPFVVVSLLRDRHHTPVVKKTVNPAWALPDATFDFPIFLSLADRLGVVEFVVWDKDMLRKEYLGEANIPLEDWFRDGNAFAFDDPDNKLISVPLVSTRTSIAAAGSIQFKLGFVTPASRSDAIDYSEVFSELVKRSRPSLVSAPPTEGIGTIRSNQIGPEFQDDGLTSDEGDSSDDEEDDSAQPEAGPSYTPPLAHLYVPPPALDLTLEMPASPVLETPTTPTAPGASTPPTVKTPTPSRPGSTFKAIPRIFPRRSNSAKPQLESPQTPGASPSHASPPHSPAVSTPGTGTTTPTVTSPRPGVASRAKFRKSWGGGANKKTDYNFSAANDILGIVMLEIQTAADLPRLKNMTRTGWDMDPFVVISFGKKVFRTRVIRHSLNPTWDEKLLFHVRRYETAFKVQLTVLDWDKLSSNDHVGDATFNVSELLANAPQKDETTGLYPEDVDGSHPMQEFKLSLTTAKEMPWEARHKPVLTIRAKYQPYDALRQRFWRQYLKQYDTDDNGTISHIELTSMLDSIGSTLSKDTIDSFFARFDKRPREDALTMDEAIQCLETELCRPPSEKKLIDPDESVLDTSAPVTPAALSGNGFEHQLSLNLDKLDFSGPPFDQLGMLKEGSSDADLLQKPAAPPLFSTEPSQQPLSSAASSSLPGSRSDSSMAAPRVKFTRKGSGSGSYSDPEESSSSPSGGSSPSSSEASTGKGGEDLHERVINVKVCPLCHRPRLNKNSEVDIVTHIATCASQDWSTVDRIMVGNFVTASQAQRKWYTKVITKVSSGNYKLGANSANIIVQNRLTGQLEEEKMQVYVRLGIRLLYKGWKSRMEGARARRLLKSMSIKQGMKYDSSESARDIPQFIAFHNLNVNEIRDPLDSFKTFNQFFYRKLKPDARPVEDPDNSYRVVSSADCRLMVFETVAEATRLWIKGREFTVARLLGERYRAEADRYMGGALCIFRLAPQDYHRFHSPVDGTIGPMTYISGEYYTVNPQAIRTALDVYGENARKIVPIDSPQFGRVMAVCIGAMMVGSIQTTVEEGQQVKRGDELGYFAFGGSTVVILFEKGVVEWDEDLSINSRACLETLVRVGMGIGRRRRGPAEPSK
ncbi:hypothetical protein FOMPIDRAFT_1055836 [Fomitopsis schrenkii]|uniref:Phosphatidylserine decarboxylase proenzyme 2 n=1 Tax=Fomitopsis schrenkii TaxID=2126942 RepID=S8F3S4_FOMSC|nr:hypothetical protein FOMPIDRAFT_1055836 [Fomitopsis schrenkii]